MQKTESSRLMRGAFCPLCEYLFELRTEQENQVGCDGLQPLLCRSMMVLHEADSVNCL